jgi:UDP-2,4-diacetamido-2,4,6-trideoxy-beta-L-altropyranose hydrolase
MRSVVIRADGDHRIGTGHLARMVRLARRFSQSGDRVTFVSRSADGCAALIKRRGYGLILLPPISDGSGAQAASAVGALEPFFVLNDVRDTTAEYMESLRSFGVRAVNFDDRGPGAELADLLIDANRRPDEAAGVTPWALFGPDYIVLDEAFERAHELPKGVRDEVAELLVLAGGSDPAGLTLKALRAVERLEPAWHTTVVLGHAYRDHAEAAVLAERCRNVDLVVGAEDLAPCMQEADMAVCSGGIAMFEVACVGTPALVGCQVPHEVHNVRLLEERGAVRGLGLVDQLTVDEIAAALGSLAGNVEMRHAMSEAGKRVVDGRGLDRVVEAIEQCVQQS